MMLWFQPSGEEVGTSSITFAVNILALALLNLHDDYHLTKKRDLDKLQETRSRRQTPNTLIECFFL